MKSRIELLRRSLHAFLLEAGEVNEEECMEIYEELSDMASDGEEA
jgi:hypothetical protein